MSGWFERFGPAGRVRLVCLPYAGGGATVYSDWPGKVPEGLEVVGVRLPGREKRLREAPLSDWPQVIDGFLTALDDEIEPPYVLFGHSLGAMIAYQAVVSKPRTLPLKVILAGCRSPEVPAQLPRLHDLPDDELAAGMEALEQTPPRLLASPGFRRLFFPMLRADLELAETWPGAESSDLTVPLVIVGADHDAIAPPWSLPGWQQRAGAGLTTYQVPGSHFFVHDPTLFRQALHF